MIDPLKSELERIQALGAGALTQCPGTLFDFDLLAKVPRHDGVLAFEANAKFFLCDND